MNIVDLLSKKKSGGELSLSELEFILDGYLNDTIPDYQISALLMAIYFQGMSNKETADLTLLMARSGDQLDLSSIPGVKVDKHSTGGVGDKTTLIVLPLAAACGVPIAKLSGRGLGHTGGTIDKLEAIPGFHTELAIDELISQTKQIHIALAGQTGNLVPADKKLYALRDVTATVDSIPLIASSVMSKKLASGADAIVLDVKCGTGAFMKTREDAKRLAQALVDIGYANGRPTTAYVTSMDRPLGLAVGNALEVEEAIDVLSMHGPKDVEELCVSLAAEMVYLGEIKNSLKEAESLVRNVLEQGLALSVFHEWIKAQGGRLDDGLADAPYKEIYRAKQSGYMVFRDVEDIGLASMRLGAGRSSLRDPIDLSAGLLFQVKAGTKVNVGDAIVMMHTSDERLFLAAKEMLDRGIAYSEEPPVMDPIILERIGK